MDTLSELERKIVELVAAEHWPGFKTDKLVVTRRENTGVGRYTDLEDMNHQQLPDGVYTANDRRLELEGAKWGAGFEIDVTGGRIRYIEIVVNGEVFWDGNERNWRIACSGIPGSGTCQDLETKGCRIL